MNKNKKHQKLKLLFGFILLFNFDVYGSSWERLPGTAKDIGIGANDAVWIIGTNSAPGGFGILKWNGKGWSTIDGGAVRIDVDPYGNPWVVNSTGNIYRRVGNRWQQLPGSAKDIGIGANGSVWIIGTNSVPGGFGIYKWNGRGWDATDGGGVRIDVDPQGNPWVINSTHNIYRRLGNRWELLMGAANDIGIGANGDVWVIGTNMKSGGFGIFQWNGGGWNGLDGGAVQISVQRNGFPWVVNANNSIFRKKRLYSDPWF